MAANIIPMIRTPRLADSLLTRDERLMELLSTYHPVTLDADDQYSEKLTWCLEHCQNKFRDIRHAEQRVWYFQNDQDATMFAMKWA